LQGLSASQDLLIKSDWHGIEMSELIQAQLYHFKDLVGTRILFGGPAAHLTAAGAQAMGMALHELATNAAKHGSLSTDEGKVRILWEISSDAEPLFSIQWIEDGGERVVAPTRKGFGHLVIGAIAESALGGKVALDFPETGLVWKLSAPAADALERK
jgi:two-component sensor histidine kinase